MNEENGKSARQYLNNAATTAKTVAHIATGNAAGVGKEVLQNPHFFGSLLFYLIIVPILIVVIVVLYFMHLPASLFDTYESITEYEVAYENYQDGVKKINGAFQKRYQELIQKGQENAQKEFAKQLEAYHAEPGGLIVKKQTPFPNDKVIVGALNILCMHAIKTDSWELTTPWALQLAVKAAVPLAMYLDEPIIEVELVPLYSEEEEGTETVIYQLFMTYTCRRMKDSFFAGSKETRKKPDEIDVHDVRLAAYSNCVNNGIKRLIPGLRNLDVNTLKDSGLDTTKMKGYTFKEGSQGGKSSDVSEFKCEQCGKKVNATVASYSQGHYDGKILCMDCQKGNRR